MADSQKHGEDRHRLLVETIPHGIEEIDTTGRITFANRAYHEMYGYADGALIGKSVLDLVATEKARDSLAAYLKILVDEQPEPTPYTGQRKIKDGGIIDVEIAWNYLRGGDGAVSGFIAVITDITDRLTAEKELEKRRLELEKTVQEGHRFFADSAAYVQTIISNMVDALITIDESGKIESFNPAAVELFGYGVDEVVGRNVRMLMTGMDHDKHDGYIARHVNTGEATIIGIGPREVIGRCKDGSEVYLELAVARTEFSGRTLFLGSLRDITKRREAELLHRESERRMEDFANISADWFFEMDADLRYSYLSDPGSLPGLDPKDILGRTRLELLRETVGQEASDGELEALQAHEPYRDVERRSDLVADQWLRVSGTPVYDEDGNFAGYRGSGSNITELYTSQQANQRLLVAIENLSEGVALFDADDRLVVRNQQYCVLNGLSPELTKPGVKFEDLLAANIANGNIAEAEDDPDAWIAERMAMWRSGAANFEQTRGRYQLLVSEMRLPDGGVVQVLLDLTEMKKREELFRQAQKMEAVGQLTGGVAHDFNNLLTIILGNAELINTKLGEHHELNRLIEPVLRSAERGAELTHRMLAFARNQPLISKRVMVNDLLVNMNLLLQRSITAEIELVTVLAPDLWSCTIDPVQFEQSVLNLAINARDAMKLRGRLEIKTENVVLAAGEAAAELDLEPGEYVAIAVSDSGEGIARENIERIFDPFFTTKDVGKGTGLGLSMVHGWANQSDGGVAVASKPGAGATFTIYLPRSPDADGEIETAEADEFDPSRHRGDETILIVEDEAELRNLVSILLEDAGYKLLSAIDGKEAMENLRAASDVDMIITDIVLPGAMNGIEVAQQALSMRRDLKVLYLSGYGPPDTPDGGSWPAHAEILSKPFEPKALLGKVRKIFDAAVAENPD